MATPKKSSEKSTSTMPAEAFPTPSGKMTKTQLVRFMAEKLDSTPKQVGTFLDLLVDTAAAQAQAAGEFTIPGLGKLVKAERRARTGRNPATGETIQIAAKTTVKFRIAKSMQEAIVPAQK